MKSSIRIISIHILTAVFLIGFFLPHFAHADIPYQPLEALPYVIPDSNGSVNIGSYIQGMFKLMIILTIFLSIVFIVLGGVQYVTTDSLRNKSDGKKRIQDAVIGLILAIVSWLILYTINPNLISFNFDFNFQGTPAVTSPTGGAPGNNGITTGPNPPTGGLSNDAAIAALGTGFTVTSSGNCDNQQDPNCTSLQGLQSSTIAGIINLKDHCPGCDNLVITGGTEVGHDSGPLSHADGYKLDISDSAGSGAALTQYLNTQLNSPQLNKWYNVTIGNTSYYMAHETDPNHWDIRVNPPS